MSRLKLTANVVAAIQSRSRAGLSARQIAKELGLSRQSVDRALAEAPVTTSPPKPKAERKPRASSAAERGASSEPVDVDELRSLLAELARGLTAQAREAQGTGDVGAYAALASKAQAAVLALAKLSPPEPDAAQEGFYVTHDAMAKAASAARALILDRVARRARGGS